MWKSVEKSIREQTNERASVRRSGMNVCENISEKCVRTLDLRGNIEAGMLPLLLVNLTLIKCFIIAVDVSILSLFLSELYQNYSLWGWIEMGTRTF